MKRILMTMVLVVILALSITTSALAQSYSFRLDKEAAEQLLRGMESLTPTEPSANGGGSGRNG